MGSTSLSDSNICRLCGISSDNAVLIFDRSADEPFYIKINRYLPIQVYDDGLYPRRVCNGCYVSVTDTQAFLERILDGQRQICRLLQQPAAAFADTGQLYPTGNPLQQQLTADGLVLQKRRPGRPRKAEQKPKVASDLTKEKQKPAGPLPPVLERSQRVRGKLPARFQDSVQGREFSQVLHGSPAGSSADDGEEEEEEQEEAGTDGEVNTAADDKAPCHIRVDVLSLPPDADADVTTPDGATAEGGDALHEAEEPAGRPVRVRSRRGRPHVLRHQCDVCGKMFLQKGRLQFHRALHRGVRYECLLCTNRFKLSSELATHQAETGHTGQGVVEGVDDEVMVDESRVQCGQCQRTFLSRHTLKVHVRQRHNADKQISCQVCHKLFGHVGALHLHMKYHAVREKRQLPCTQCAKVYNSRASLAYHTESAHSSGRLFICNMCGKSFRLQQLLARHALVHNNERKFQCAHCPMVFKTRCNLTNHTLCHTGEKRLVCSHCSRRFAHLTSLQSHMRLHTGIKPYECQVCKKRFTQSSNLQQHARVHSGEKPFPCTVCLRAFATGSQLSMHMRRHGAGRPFTCKACGKQLATRDLWRAHQRLHVDCRTHVCPVCGKQLANAASLGKHVRLHTAADQPADQTPQQHSCDVCAWTFSDEADLKQHVASHASSHGHAHILESTQPNQPEPLLLPSKTSQVIYVTYQNPADPSTVQFVDGTQSEDGGQTVHLSADSEVLLEDAAAGVVQLAANKGLVTAEGTRTLELTTDDGRRIQITLHDDKSDLEPAELAAATSAASAGAGGDTLLVVPSVGDEANQSVVVPSVEADCNQPESVVPEPTEGATVLVTARDGRQFRLVTPAGVDPVQFAAEYVASLAESTAPQLAG